MRIEEKIRAQIKSTLRVRRISYAQLADDLDVSESTVKRMLTRSRITINDYERICHALGISLVDVLISAGSQSELETLTHKQEAFLCDNPITDYIFLRLMFGFSILDCKEELSLDKHEMERHLLKLDSIGLIRYGKGGRVRLIRRGPFRWVRGGPFENKFRVSFFVEACRLLTDFIRQPKDPRQRDKLPQAVELYLTDESYQKLTVEIDELILKYQKLTRLEQTSIPVRYLHPVVCVAAAVRENLWRRILIKNEPHSHKGKAGLDQQLKR